MLRSRIVPRSVYLAVIRVRLRSTLFHLPFLLALMGADLCFATDNSVWKYDLRPGDHLVYHYAFERAYRGEDSQSRTRTEYTSHVVVLGQRAGGISVGFQRNREMAELLAYRERGKDRLSEELPKFRERLAKRSSHFSEAMEFNSLGEPLAFWEAARETAGRLIMGVHEVEGLPSKPPAVGDSWKGANLLGITFKLAAREVLGLKNCNRVDGTDARDAVHLRYWWCDGVGAIEKMEFDGEYSVPGGTVLETARFELKDKQRGESLAQWLDSPDVRDAALQALLLSPWIGVKNEMLDAVLRLGDAHTQILVLTYLYQTNQKSFTLAIVQSLSRSTDPTVKRLAAHLLAPDKDALAEPPESCKLKAPTFPAQKIGTTIRLLSDPKSGAHPYMVRVPGDYRVNKKSPLLVYLSGGGGLAVDGVNTAEDVVAGTDYVVLYPQAGDYWWTPEIRSRVDTLLSEVLHEFNVDTNRIYIAGFSNGGTGALDYAQLWPQRFAAVVSLMGAGQCNPQVAAGLKNLTQIPTLFVHGEKDPRIEVACSRDTFDALKRLNPKIEPVLHILEKREHDITLNQDDGLTLPFLSGKTRDPFPRKFAATWEDLSFPRRYWVEVLEKGSGPAEVDARILADNRIEVTAHGVKRVRVLLRPELLTSPSPITVFLNKRIVFEGDFKSDCNILSESSLGIGDPMLGYEQALDFEVGK